MSWITSAQQCRAPWAAAPTPSPASMATTLSRFEMVQEWIAFIAFAPCPQQILASSLNLLFLFYVSAAALLFEFHFRTSTPPPSPLLSNIKSAKATSSSTSSSTTVSSSSSPLSIIFRGRGRGRGSCCCSTNALFACVSAGLTIVASAAAAFATWWAWYRIDHHPAAAAPPYAEAVYLWTEAAAWIACLAVLWRDASSTFARQYHMNLRVWWFCLFLVSLLQSLSALFRVLASSGFSYDPLLRLLDLYDVLKFLASLCNSLLAASTGFESLRSSKSTSYSAVEAIADDTQIRSYAVPLLGNGGKAASTTGTDEEGDGTAASATGFAEASIWSRATFAWLTPVLAAGAKQSQLQMEAVPELAPSDRATNMHDLLRRNWPKSESTRRPLTRAIVVAFLPQLAFTALLQLIRSLAMFGGPLLIRSFTSYTQGVYVSRYDGFSLVLMLFLSKATEVMSYHQFNFQCYRMGNNMRTGIVTLLYEKALRLSSSSRQAHGVGQITNYMVVDAQNISDACLQIHLLWAVPLQVAIAIAILYFVLGVAPMLGGLGALLLIALSTAAISQWQRRYQSGLMEARDTRMKAIIESLAFIKLIKLQAWEDKFRERIVALRRDEYVWLKAFVLATAFNMFLLWNGQSFVSSVTYLTAVLVRTPLTTSVVFTAASVFRIIQSQIRNFPQALISLTQILVAFERLDSFMLSAELQAGAVIRSPDVPPSPDAVVVEVTDGSFAWGEEAQPEPTIRDVNLSIRKGSLVAVVGGVGAGKSSLLAALLGEMIRTSGKAEVKGSVAYVSQSAWIQNATIEENIRMVSNHSKKKKKDDGDDDDDDDYYGRVVRGCALIPDLEALEHGDQTEIGERGINLSGGQKQRIQLARALYQRSHIYLLDDVFSAVDAHTGSHLFKECILGLLRGKTVVLVTHQVEFLAGADLVLFMKDGRIAESGKYEEILSASADFRALVAAHNEAMDAVHHATHDVHGGGAIGDVMILERRMREVPERPSFTRIVSTDDLDLIRTKSIELMTSTSTSFPSAVDFRSPDGDGGTAKLIEAEQRETGKVSLKIYVLYLTKVFGWAGLILLILDQVLWQVLLVCADFWISDQIPATAGGTYDRGRFLRTYLSLGTSSWVMVLLRVLLVAAMGLATAQLFFHQVLATIFRAPISFFDTTPSGRILSRFSSDQTNVDFMLHYYMGGCIASYMATIGSIVVICISTWPIIFFIVPLAFLYKWYQDFYLASSREMTRLDAITKAPLIYHFSETVAGIETIRCFQKEDEFIKKSYMRLEMNMKMDFNNNSANEWLGLRLESMGTAILTMTGILFVVLPENTIRPEFVGLALSYALALNIGLYWTVWLTCMLENKMVSVERLQQYTDIPSEAEFVIQGCLRDTPGWPEKGEIVCSRLKLRYRPSTPLVLKGVSFRVEGGQKVGVVGRTGSGKSTLLLAVFRLVEPVGGQICIDGIDITNLGLYDLRSRLGIIPQEPVLFQGSVRANLDPFNSYSDDAIWRALEKCQLDAVVREKTEKLDAAVTEHGGNWSVGQRQLLCFGRALLKNSKLLFLDEATASIDALTDSIIQGIIRTEFQESTVVSIAHRIPTVMDSDRVLVMDAGRVREFDTPGVLLNKPNSLFSSLVREYKSRSDPQWSSTNAPRDDDEDED